MSDSLLSVKPGNQKILFLPEEELDEKRITEREQLRKRRQAVLTDPTLAQKELPIDAEYPDKKTAKKVLTEQVIENRDRLKEAEGKYYTPLGSNLKKLEYRSDIPTRVKVGESVFETKSVTQVAEDKAKTVGLSNPPQAKFEVDEIPGLKLTSDEFRTYTSTGIYRGEFINPIVLDHVERLDQINPETGKTYWPEGRSLKGFLKAMSYGWNTIAEKEAKFVQKQTGIEQHKGHGRSVKEGGSNWWTNVAPQFARATDPDDPYIPKEGPDKIVANLAIGEDSLKGLDDLEMAGNYGVDVPKAFQAYLTEGDEGILDLRRFDKAAHTRILHGTERTAEGQVFEEELNLRREVFEDELSKAPQETPKVKANRAFKVFRRLASAAGTSNNPLANLGGDVVGVVMDGVAFAQNPKDPSNLIDLGLSGTQALASIGALGLSFVPIPGARAGAFLLMKAGDKVATIERLYGMGGRDVIGNKFKPSDIMKIKKATKL